MAAFGADQLLDACAEVDLLGRDVDAPVRQATQRGFQFFDAVQPVPDGIEGACLHEKILSVALEYALFFEFGQIAFDLARVGAHDAGDQINGQYRRESENFIALVIDLQLSVHKAPAQSPGKDSTSCRQQCDDAQADSIRLQTHVEVGCGLFG